MVAAEGEMQNDGENLEEMTVSLKKKKIHCEVCDVSYAQRTGLARHNKQRHTHDFSLWECKDYDCSYTSLNKADINRHMAACHGLPPYLAEKRGGGKKGKKRVR